VRPIRRSLRDASGDAEGLDGGAPRLGGGEAQDPERVLARGESVEGGQRLRRGDEVERRLHGAGQKAPALVEHGSGVGHEAAQRGPDPTRVRAGEGGGGDRLQPGFRSDETARPTQVRKGRERGLGQRELVGVADTDQERVVRARALAQLGGADEVPVQAREFRAVRQVGDGGQDGVPVLQARPERGAGRPQRLDVRRGQAGLGGEALRPVGEPGVAIPRARDPAGEVGRALVAAREGGELGQGMALDLPVDRRQARARRRLSLPGRG
jgi:hypothetical protein